MDKKKIIYIGSLLILTVIVSITYFSYAFFTHKDEQHGKLNIVAGTLDYKIESDDLENNSITLSANESKEIEITIKSVNKINSKYQLYTNNVENVDIRYTAEEESGVGTIDSNGTKTVKVVLENNSDTDKTITFGVQGGFEDKTLTLEDNRVAVVLGEGLCKIGQIYTFDYTGNVQEFTTKCSGTYKLETWGASGYEDYSSGGTRVCSGKGAYTGGIISLLNNEVLYLYVGSVNSYNGGGTGEASGGGATDIRLIGNDWNDFESLKSRIMVAAGGGGAFFSANTSNWSSGHAGGLIGYNANAYHNNDYLYPNYSGSGGTQTTGGATGTDISSAKTAFANAGYTYDTSHLTGVFGQGGYSNTGSSGGGGGYYGGGHGIHPGGTWSGGGGGSSFISGYSGCNAIAESSTSNNIVHTGQANHYSGKIFTNGVMIDGKGCDWSTGTATNCGANQPQPDGTNATGHTGNGYARITYLGE